MDIFEERKRARLLSKEFSRTKGFNVFMGKYRIETILEHCKNRETLLDLGCAYGKITKALSPFFKRILGVDGSKELIEQAKKVLAKQDANQDEWVQAEEKLAQVLQSIGTAIYQQQQKTDSKPQPDGQAPKDKKPDQKNNKANEKDKAEEGQVVDE